MNKRCVSVESARNFTLSLGFAYQELQKGTFSDKHEDKEFQDDRRLRFLPTYKELYNTAPNTIKHQDGEVIEADIVDDVLLRVHVVDVTGDDGVTREVDIGGILPSGDGLVHLIASHDESCFKSGEREKSG